VNERIIEFRKQCLTEVKDEHGNWINYHFDENKFAELIIRKCCAIADEAERADVPVLSSKFVKAYFGIE
jgi:hypothetical protein